MIPLLIPVLIGMALCAVAVSALRRWARSLPVAHAWNPETHDRQTYTALHILRAEEAPNGPVTLFGWVLRQLAEPRHGLYEEYIGQIRRGSIEEDMNSHTINEFEAASTIVDGLLIAGMVATLSPWLLAFYVAKKAGGHFLEQTEAIAGANGGYHYYNPMHGNDATAGLSEPTYIGQVLSKVSQSIGSGTLKAPMESAVTRALDASAARQWPFDYEDRNYTYDDAQRYFRMGYPALGFYALGRVAHLLEDMAVPAHVRDDSHLGINLPPPYGEPGEPLEYLASDLDWDSVTPAEGAVSKTVKWSYRPKRGWATAGTDMLAVARAEYQSIRAGAKNLPPREHFYQLAHWAHNGFYCLGTIPGNRDAHDPNGGTQPWWRKGAPVDWSKCAPNVKGLCARFGPLAASAKAALESHQAMMTQYEGQLQNYSVDSFDMSTMRGQLMAEKAFGEELLATLARDVIPNLDGLVESRDRFIRVVEALSQVTRQMGALSDPNPQYGPTAPMPWKNVTLDEFRASAEPMDLDRLLVAAKGAPDLVEALKTYIRGFGSDDERLARAFEPAMPFCLTREILMSQYRQTTPRAAARAAAMMADWFESLYASGDSMGIGLWQNAEPANGVIPTEYRVDTATEAAPAKTYGVANHLPAPVEMTCEFTLVDLTDAKTGASVTDRRVSVDIIVGHVSPSHFNAVSTIRDPAAPMKPGELDVRGRDDRSVEVGHREARSFTFGCAPHALGTQKAFRWPPKGTWGAGAIRREEEAEQLKPVNLTPGQAPAGASQATRDDLFATFLHLTAKMVPEEKEQR